MKIKALWNSKQSKDPINVYILQFVVYGSYHRAIVINKNGQIMSAPIEELTITDACYVGTGRAKLNG